jgi:hypothetical protein
LTSQNIAGLEGIAMFFVAYIWKLDVKEIHIQMLIKMKP